MNIPNLSLAKEISQALQQQQTAAGQPGAVQPDSKFQVQGDQDASKSQGVQGVAATEHPHAVSEAAKIPAPEGPRKLAELVNGPKSDDPVKFLENVRKWMLDHCGDGSMKELTLGDMIGLQILAQDATRRLELTTKVVEHATSGVKTVLQTQA
ncbi:MAG: hypothetical protein JSV78_09305 [Phycisphaerales bacterium]|nr:MAG: hypothetical protein JSV78_09305 [Phycisphaerales bacterium]